MSQTPEISIPMTTANVTPINKYLTNVIQSKDNIWNEEYENIVLGLSNKAKGYRYVYTEAVNYYSTTSKFNYTISNNN